MLPLHITLLKRYASLKWPIYLATEVPDDPLLNVMAIKHGFTIIPLTQSQEGFLESRAAAASIVKEKYILPMQEDFLLEGRPIAAAIEDVLKCMDTYESVQSVRLMPSPAPKGDEFAGGNMKVLGEKDDYHFTYQATLWRREAYQEFMSSMAAFVEKTYSPSSQAQRAYYQIKRNDAEGEHGKTMMKGIHLAWPREGSQPNAVYLSPWPYRPTAVIDGILQKWAIDLAKREGMSF